MRTALLTAALFCLLRASNVQAEDVVAIVDLKFIEETDVTAAVICFGENECDVWATHYLWEARVRKLISGTETDDRFLVLFGVHALKKQNLRNVVATMTKLEPGAYGNARYRIEEWGQRRELLCFAGFAAPNAPLDLKHGDSEPQKCFETGEEGQ